MSKPEEKILFCIAEDATNQPVLILGIPEQAWDYMKDGKTHTFDLTSTGLPLQLMLFGCKSHQEAYDFFKEYTDKTGVKLDDRRGKKDFGIKPPNLRRG